MKRNKNTLLRQSEISYNTHHSLFAFTPIIPQIIIIAIVIAVFYYIKINLYFPLWINYIYYGVKAIIALEIIIAAAKSITGPILAILIGGLNLYAIKFYNLPYLSNDHSMQLIIIGAIGLVITFIVRSIKH